MGQLNSTLNGQSITALKEIKSPAFGPILLCDSKGCRFPLFAAEVVSSNNEPEFYLGLKHPNLVSPIQYESHLKEVFQMNSSGITFYFEYLNYSLQDAIEQKISSQTVFSEEQIVEVAISILQALEYLKQNDIEGGDVEPLTIFYDNEGKIKIYINQMILGENASYNMICKGFFRQVICSPEVMYSTQRRNKDLVDQYRFNSDVFNLGMSLLAMCTLSSSTDIINYNEKDFRSEILESRINIVENQYSFKLSQLIKKMLILDPKNRPSCESLLIDIKEYQHQPSMEISQDYFIPANAQQQQPSFISASQSSPQRSNRFTTTTTQQQKSLSPQQQLPVNVQPKFSPQRFSQLNQFGSSSPSRQIQQIVYQQPNQHNSVYSSNNHELQSKLMQVKYIPAKFQNNATSPSRSQVLIPNIPQTIQKSSNRFIGQERSSYQQSLLLSEQQQQKQLIISYPLKIISSASAMASPSQIQALKSYSPSKIHTQQAINQFSYYSPSYSPSSSPRQIHQLKQNQQQGQLVHILKKEQSPQKNVNMSSNTSTISVGTYPTSPSSFAATPHFNAKKN